MQTYFIMLLQVLNNETPILASIGAVNLYNLELKSHFKPVSTLKIPHPLKKKKIGKFFLDFYLSNGQKTDFFQVDPQCNI